MVYYLGCIFYLFLLTHHKKIVQLTVIDLLHKRKIVPFHYKSLALCSIQCITLRTKEAMITDLLLCSKKYRNKKIKLTILSLKSMSSLIGNTFILISGNLTPFSHFTVGEQKGCFCLIYSV